MMTYDDAVREKERTALSMKEHPPQEAPPAGFHWHLDYNPRDIALIPRWVLESTSRTVYAEKFTNERDRALTEYDIWRGLDE